MTRIHETHESNMPTSTSRRLTIIERVALTGIAIGLMLLLLGRIGALRAVGGRGFLIIVGAVILANVFWWAWVLRHLHGTGDRAARSSRPRRLLRAAWTAYCLLMLMPFALILLPFGLRWDALSVPILAWTIIWHLLLAGLGGAAVIMTIVLGAARLVRKPHRAAETVSTKAVEPLHAGATTEAPAAPPRLTRRRLLAGATAAAPLIITGASTIAGHRQEGRFLCRELTLHLPRLPERLRGLTITQITDLHVGRFFRPEHLPRLVEAANRLRGDLVAITGDLVDHSNDYLPATQAALAQIKAPYGRFIVLGNHDLMDDAEELITYLDRRERYLLCDRLERVNIGGETIQIAGLFWSRQEGPGARDPLGLNGRAARTLARARRDDFTLALTHHPHAFEALAAGGADLVLAGHTHGGQLMLTPPGFTPRIGAGNLLFRYIQGEYTHGAARLFVSTGVGNWFPVRINAPAEIVRLRLI